jgi:hypothetical protein
MAKILFVDDEREVLDLLGRGVECRRRTDHLRRHRKTTTRA